MNLFRLNGKPIAVQLGDESISIPLFTIDDFTALAAHLDAQDLKAVHSLTDEQLGIDKKKGKAAPDPHLVLKYRLILDFRERTEAEMKRHVATIPGSVYVVAKCLSKIEGWTPERADEVAKSIPHDDRTVLAWLLCGYGQLTERLTNDGKDEKKPESPQ